MKNIWLTVGNAYWTYEILDDRKNKMVSETTVSIDECPSMKIVEKLEIEENGKKVWKPVLVVWEKFEVTYTDESFLDNHDHIRLLEADGDAVGILRHYDSIGNHIESWVMHGLQLTDIDFLEESNSKKLQAEFTFHHALYLTN